MSCHRDFSGRPTLRRLGVQMNNEVQRHGTILTMVNNDGWGNYTRLPQTWDG